MFSLITMLVIAVLLISATTVAVYRHYRKFVVLEGYAAVTATKNGFVNRVLPTGCHILQPFEKVLFTVEVKTRPLPVRTVNVATSNGVMLTIQWTGALPWTPRSLPRISKSGCAAWRMSTSPLSPTVRPVCGN